MIISVIAAVTDNLAIGKDNKLLFKIKEDLQRFKKLTLGHTIIMGSNTFRSLPHALPGRRNIVLSGKETEFEGCTVFDSLIKALASCDKDEEVFIIGGGCLYDFSIPYADRLYITEIHKTVEDADTFFPEYKNKFRCIERESRGWYDFTKYMRKNE